MPPLAGVRIVEIAQNLAGPYAGEILARLGADALVQNLRAGWLESLGLGAEAVRALNPRIVDCSLSAFGPTGPLRQRPGYEPMMQAFSELMLTGGHDGDPPGRIGVPVLDCGTGMWAALGVLAGLLRRERTGTGTKGEWLDRLEQSGVPCAPVQALAEVAEHPQTAASGIVQPVPGGDLTLIGLPLRLDGARPPIPGPAPRLGEHDTALDHA